MNREEVGEEIERERETILERGWGVAELWRCCLWSLWGLSRVSRLAVCSLSLPLFLSPPLFSLLSLLWRASWLPLAGFLRLPHRGGPILSSCSRPLVALGFLELGGWKNSGECSVDRRYGGEKRAWGRERR